MRHLSNVELGVLELRRPEQRIERADVNADSAVHTQREVDGEPVENVSRALPTTFVGRRYDLFVRVDVDAPVWALPCTQHAGGAVLLEQCDYPTAARWKLGLHVGVLLSDRTLGHRGQRDAKALEQPGSSTSPARHHATITTPVSRSWASATGINSCHASFCSWSARRRGKLTRSQITTNASTPAFTKVHTHESATGPFHPPRNSTAVRKHSSTIPTYSASKKSAK